MNVIIQIMQQEEFQTEFDQLIDEFDAQTYFVNFSLSLLDSLVYHVDDDITFFNGLDENTKQILKIMFTGEDGIKVSSLLTQEDAKELLKASLAILNASVDNTDPETENESNANLKKTLNYGKVIIPEILELSILNEEERSKPMNKVLKNLYDYFAVKLEDSNSEGTEINYSPTDRAMKLTNTTSDEIDWVAELKNLLNTGLSTLELYDSIYTADGEMTDKLFEFFAEENTSLEENEKLYDSVTTGLSNSKLLGVIMSMSFMSNMVNEMVLQIIPNAVLPSTFDYANELDDDGNITQYGEVYHLLTTIKFLAKNKDSKTLLESFSGNADKEAIRQISNFLNTDIGENKTMLDQIFESEIFEYAISGLILNLSIDEGMNLAIYVPQDCRELGREDIPLIVKPELKKMIINLPVLLDIMEKNENIDVNTIVKDLSLIHISEPTRP